MDGIKGSLERSEAEGIPCPAQPPVWQRLYKSAGNCSKRLAFASLHQQPTLCSITADLTNLEYLRWSYGNLNFAVNTLVGKLQKLGAKRGQPVTTFLYNGAEFIMAFWAAHKLVVHLWRSILEVSSTVMRLPTCFAWLVYPSYWCRTAM